MVEPVVVVIVSGDPSDIYFANKLIKKLNVVGVFIEKQHEKSGIAIQIMKALQYTLKPWQLLKKVSYITSQQRQFDKGSKIVSDLLGEESSTVISVKGCEIVHTNGVNAINRQVYVDKIKSLEPDVIAVCGSSILKNTIISIPNKGVLNLHGGLSQKYRGVMTTLWAVYNEEPEYIGATVHYVDSGIDTGNIVYQGRPIIEADDNQETLYVKVVKLGIDLMIKAVEGIKSGTNVGRQLEEKGTLYLGKMVTPDVISKTWKKINQGVIRKYLSEKAARDQKVITMMNEIKAE